MKRFDIRNKATGLITHSYEAESAWESPSPEWGTPAHEEPVFNPEGPTENADGTPVLQTVPASYDVIETDISYEYALRACWASRLSEYPSIGDQLDAIYKRDHLDEPAQWQAIAAQIDAVKAKFPKPPVPTT